jgi:hypothetical protein
MKWAQIRTQLLGLDTKELVAVIKALHQLSSENRDFLEARFSQGIERQAALQSYKQRIHIIFFPRRGLPEKLDLRAGRKAINQYQKATEDHQGTLDLMLFYVENGTEFSDKWGDIDEPFYNSLESVLGELAKRLKGAENGAKFYDYFYKRLQMLARTAGRMGWGYGDFVLDIVGGLDDFFGKPTYD